MDRVGLRGSGNTDLIITPMSYFQKNIQNGQRNTDGFRLKEIGCIQADAAVRCVAPHAYFLMQTLYHRLPYQEDRDPTTLPWICVRKTVGRGRKTHTRTRHFPCKERI